MIYHSSSAYPALVHQQAQAHLLLEIDALEGERVCDDGKRDKVVVGHELGGGERAQCVEEEHAATGELPDGYGVEALVNLEPVPAVPVAAVIDESTISS